MKISEAMAPKLEDFVFRYSKEQIKPRICIFFLVNIRAMCPLLLLKLRQA